MLREEIEMVNLKRVAVDFGWEKNESCITKTLIGRKIFFFCPE